MAAQLMVTKGFSARLGIKMQGAGEKLFAGPGFTLDKDGAFGGGDIGDYG